MTAFQITVKDHYPANKTKYQVRDSFCEVRVNNYDGSGTNPNAWLEIFLIEVYTPENSNRQMSRTIHLTLNTEQRAALLAYLKETE